jgi:hypothetical protein
MAVAGAQPPATRRPAQGYANHAYRPVATAVAGSFVVLALSVAILIGLRGGSILVVLALVSLTFAVMTLVLISRSYTVRLQNRIIRLEMQLRLASLGRGDVFSRLSMPQVAALRFAGDAELPALADRAVQESLTADQIKRAVTDWQGDFFRT